MNRIKFSCLLVIAFLFALVYYLNRLPSVPASPPSLPGTGTVTGQLVLEQPDSPYSTQDLYLGKLIRADRPDTPPIISFTYGVDPQTALHEPDGKFAFTNVPPGTYALIVWTAVGGFPIESSEGGFIEVVVQADKVTNLGRVILR